MNPSFVFVFFFSFSFILGGVGEGCTPVRPYEYLPMKDFFKIVYVLHEHRLNFLDYL
jgi:hypothetical protein